MYYKILITGLNYSSLEAKGNIMKKSPCLMSALSTALLVSSLFISGCATTDGLSTTSGVADAITPDITLNKFVDVRLASIQQDAAQGKGENLDALADLMGKSDKQAFSGWMQTNYDVLFTDLEQPAQLISRIKAVAVTMDSL